MTEFEVSPDQKAAVDQLAQFVTRFGLTIPCVLALESVRPLSFVGSQCLHMISPSLGIFLPPAQLDALAALLEDRRGLGYIIDQIERLDAQRSAS